MVPSGFSTPSATSQIRINGAQSLQPVGLRPAPSLSTLNPRRYRCKPKTRYGMCWVGTFPVALAATSSSALRGAPKISHFSGYVDNLYSTPYPPRETVASGEGERYGGTTGHPRTAGVPAAPAAGDVPWHQSRVNRR